MQSVQPNAVAVTRPRSGGPFQALSVALDREATLGYVLVAPVVIILLALVAYPLLLTYVVLWLALVPAGVLRRYNRLGDYSYGFYLWQFPIQQWIVLTHHGIAQPLLLAGSLPAALAIAVASWHLVERPALALKERAGRA